MATTTILDSLPQELLLSVLSYLPHSSLLSFALTSKSNYSISHSAIDSLHLAILPRSIHAKLTFLHTNSDAEPVSSPSSSKPVPNSLSQYDLNESADHQIYLPSPTACTRHFSTRDSKSKLQHGDESRNSSPKPSPSDIRNSQIEVQNALAHSTLSKSSLLSNLQTLSIHMYDFTSPSLAAHLAQLASLQNLHLNFSHKAHVHDPCLPAYYFRHPPPKGTSAWNAVAGLGVSHARDLKLRNLRALTVNRASLTRAQLCSWIAANNNLRVLRLRTVTGVDSSFLEWLADYAEKQDRTNQWALEVIDLSSSPNLELKTKESFKSLTRLFRSPVAPTIKAFFLRNCKEVNTTVAREVAEEEGWRIAPENLILGDETSRSKNKSNKADADVNGEEETEGQSTERPIEVDPRHVMPTNTAMASLSRSSLSTTAPRPTMPMRPIRPFLRRAHSDTEADEHDIEGNIVRCITASSSSRGLRKAV